MGSLYCKDFILDHHVTYHACERFVERVFGLDKSKINSRILKVKEEIFLQVSKYIGLQGKIKVLMPDYPEFYAVLKDGVVVTVYKKENNV